ncbi:dihydrodipicolinate synthase family protein [Curtobacterium ammoniigenes]|uniref:dihydrodipicolinate synthase family protein n=1 Tax=Curtobacterium ammoniigenes TaxID=395387 RepID=UPI000830ADAF|nr:dihydrodipicolinate synthase family protein [Curtobacterium ammoniigenes]
MNDLTLVDSDGRRSTAPLRPAPAWTKPASPLSERVVYAAAHVVPRVTGDNTPGAPADIDWEATLAFRHHLWSWGLGVADAMDTAQRNMGLDPPAVRALIARSAAEAQSVGGRIVVGVNTDDIESDSATLDEIVAAYIGQLRHAEEHGAGTVLMASRHLARAATGPDDYRRVYERVIAAADEPVVLHWLGPAFDPILEGYFGSRSVAAATETVLRIIGDAGERVSGIKMSLLDADAEIAVRDRLPGAARMFTGDDYHYVDLMSERDGHHSDALLGAFAAVGPVASAAVQALAEPDGATLFRTILEPTEALSRHIFAAPTWHYKTGIAFLAWLNGHQPAFTMVGGLHAARSVPHLSEIVRLANVSGALEQPELAAARWDAYLRLAGVVSATVLV